MKLSKFELEASRLYPIPLVKEQPSDWDAEKYKHIAYWIDRFGLQDVRPFSMNPGKIRVRINWKRMGNKLNIETVFSNQMKETHSISYTPDAIFEYIIKLSRNYKLVFSDFDRLDNEQGDTSLFSPKLPEHDWLVWTRDLYKGTRYKLKRRLVGAAIDRYRTQKDFLTDLESLKEYIYAECRSDQN